MIVSETFKNKIKKLGRQFDVLVSYTTMYKLITEDEKLLITQDNVQLISEQMSTEYDAYINGEDIIKLDKNNLGELFKTYMKSFDIESTQELYVGQNINVQLGVKEEQDENYEYINYGTYYVYEKKYNEDTKTFSYVVCDSMLFTMIPFNINYMMDEQVDEVSVEDAIKNILVNCGIDRTAIDLEGIVNGDKLIYRSSFDGLEVTCRDVLDMIMQTTGSSLITYDDNGVKFTYKTIGSEAVETIDGDTLSNKNLSFEKKFGKINSLLFSRASGTDNIERKDIEDISANGYVQYVIEDNMILDQENRADYIDNLFNAIKNIEYYICDFDCLGLGYIEYLDIFNVNAQGNVYPCICLKNTYSVQSGMSESFKSEEPTQVKKTYTKGGKDDKKVSILLDKLKGTLVLKTDNDGKISQVRLDSSGDEGSLVEIGADNIKLEGTTTINERFKIDNNGYMYAKAGGEIAGWKIRNTALYKDVRIGDYDYRVYIQSPLTDYTEDSWIFSTQKKHKNESGYSGTSVIKMGGDASFQKMSCGLNDSGTRYISEYGMYFTDETFTMQGVNDYTKYTHNACSVNGQGHFNGYVYGWNFYSTSSIKSKKNIKHFNDSALEIIKNTDIYNYNFTNEEKNVKKHIGFVIGDGYNYDERITNNENEGVDLYSFVSVCCKAIQEQQEQIEELKKEIENLKGGNK